MFIVNLVNPKHRELIVLLDKQEVKTKIIWKVGFEYGLEPITYIDYVKAKECQNLIGGDSPII